MQKRFDDVISLDKKGNLLILTGASKKAEIELIEEKFLPNDVKLPELDFEEKFELPSAKLHEMVKDSKMNKDFVLTLKTGKDKVILSNTGKYKFTTELEAKGCTGGNKVDFGQPFVDAINSFDGTLEMQIKTDYPIQISETTNNSTITLIVAPRVGDEE